MVLQAIIDVATKKAEYEVADILRLHLGEYLQKYHCTAHELRVLNALMRCRTAENGGHIRTCSECGRIQIAYNPCGNRNCMKCGSFAQAQWVAKMERLLLPVPYFHTVFTTDHRINDLAYHNPEVIYNLLFASANQVLKEYGKRYLKGKIGVTMALHTWGQTLQPHIHVHCMVTGGALVRTNDGYAWRASAKRFLFPVEQLSADFRKTFCEGLLNLYQTKQLRLVGSCANLDIPKLVAQMLAIDWEVYIEKPVAGVNSLVGYFARYLHKTAISNSRIRKVENGLVTFEYRDNRERDERQRGKLKQMTLSALEFIHRFVRHILPQGFVRMRHFGLHASALRLKLQVARMLLGQSFELPPMPKLDLREWLSQIGQTDALRCPFCKVGFMRLGRDFAPLLGLRLWMLALLGLPIFGQEVT